MPTATWASGSGSVGMPGVAGVCGCMSRHIPATTPIKPASAGRRADRQLAPLVRADEQRADRVQRRLLAVVLEEVRDAVRTARALLDVPLVPVRPQVHILAGDPAPPTVPPVLSLLHPGTVSNIC